MALTVMRRMLSFRSTVRVTPVLLAFSGVVVVLLAQLQHHFSIGAAGVFADGWRIPWPLVLALVAAVLASSTVVAIRLTRVFSGLDRRSRLSVVGLMAVFVVSLSGAWYGLMLDGLRPWVFREGLALAVSA